MPNSRRAQSIPTVSRISGETIVELVYDRPNRKTGLVISQSGNWRIEQEVELQTGERLVPYSPQNNLIAHDCVLLPSHPEEFGTKEQLVADIESFLHRYVDLSPTFERIASHYVLLTWLHDAFAELPYLRLRGDYGTGKTRGLIAIGSLCYKPFFAAGASTVSPIFHTLDRFGGTLILDEADFRFTDATADLVKVFNNGTVRGLPVLRTIQNRNKEFNPAAFNVFGPKIIAMRGSFDDDALESRFLTEETGSHAMRGDIPLHLPDSLHPEALALRNRLLDFRLKTRFATRINATLAMAQLDPRLNQITLPLLSLMDQESLRAEVCTRLVEEQAHRRTDRQRTIEGRVLKAVLECLAVTPADVPVQAIANQLDASDGADAVTQITPRRVGSVLKSAFRVHTRKSNGVYVVSALDKPKLEACAERFGLARP